MTNDRFLKAVDSIIIDIHPDYRQEIIGLIEDLRHVFGQLTPLLVTKESNQLLRDLDGDIACSSDTGDILCVLFAKNLLLDSPTVAAQMISLLVDYSTKDDGSGYRRTVAKLAPFLVPK